VRTALPATSPSPPSLTQALTEHFARLRAHHTHTPPPELCLPVPPRLSVAATAATHAGSPIAATPHDGRALPHARPRGRFSSALYAHALEHHQDPDGAPSAARPSRSLDARPRRGWTRGTQVDRPANHHTPTRT
jgi:hypothetical protein